MYVPTRTRILGVSGNSTQEALSTRVSIGVRSVVGLIRQSGWRTNPCPGVSVRTFHLLRGQALVDPAILGSDVSSGKPMRIGEAVGHQLAPIAGVVDGAKYTSPNRLDVVWV